MKRVLEAKTSFAYEYIFFGEGGRSSKTMGGEPFWNRAETICSVVFYQLRRMTTGLYECPWPPPPAEVSRRFVAGKGSSWQLPPSSNLCPRNKKLGRFSFDEDISTILEDGGKKFTQRNKKGNNLPLYISWKILLYLWTQSALTYDF